MPKTTLVVDGIVYIVEELGASKFCTAIGKDIKIERAYVCGKLQYEEIRKGVRIEMRYYMDGKLHRDRSPACYIRDSGFSGEYWFKNGQRHRADGPAIEEVIGGVIYRAYYRNDYKLKKPIAAR